MSIDSPLHETSDLAKQDNIDVVNIITESPSAKETDQRSYD